MTDTDPPADPGARSRLGNVAGALLLGGRFQRTGRDEASLERQGVACSTRTARLLARLFEETLLVGGAPEAAAPGRRVVDPAGPSCALRGLVAALDASEAERVLVVATDLPCLTADLLLALTAWPEADAVVPTDVRGDHPLCAIYRRERCLATARARLESGQLALSDLLHGVETARAPIEALGVAEGLVDPFTNVDTPAQLARREGA